jgi:hypothetical protein
MRGNYGAARRVSSLKANRLVLTSSHHFVTRERGFKVVKQRGDGIVVAVFSINERLSNEVPRSSTEDFHQSKNRRFGAGGVESCPNGFRPERAGAIERGGSIDGGDAQDTGE